MTIIIFLIVLAILIFVHELGHFIAARTFGIRVDAFALGFGPKIFGKTVGETTYSLNLIPFGGYVKIFGENPDDESINGVDRARSFVHMAKWKQATVLFAGIFFNFVFASILVATAFSFGVSAPVSSFSEYKDHMYDQHIVITLVNRGSPADKAGLKAGDVLNVSSAESFQKEINDSASNGVNVKYTRAGKEYAVNVIAEKGIVQDRYAIGVAMDNVGTLKLPFFAAVIESIRFTLHSITAMIAGLYQLIVGIFDGKSTLASISGPVGIAGMVGDAAKIGFTYLLMFTAIISINLGVLNLIPFPALDGGRILFVVIEAVIRRPIKPVIANTVNALGFGLLILLMIVVTYKDIANLFVK